MKLHPSMEDKHAAYKLVVDRIVTAGGPRGAAADVVRGSRLLCAVMTSFVNWIRLYTFQAAEEKLYRDAVSFHKGAFFALAAHFLAIVLLTDCRMWYCRGPVH